MRCRKCLKVFKATQLKNKICWKKYNMCVACAVIYHPEGYTKNFVLAILAKSGRYKSPRRKYNTYHKVNGVTDG